MHHLTRHQRRGIKVIMHGRIICGHGHACVAATKHSFGCELGVSWSQVATGWRGRVRWNPPVPFSRHGRPSSIKAFEGSMQHAVQLRSGAPVQSEGVGSTPLRSCRSGGLPTPLLPAPMGSQVQAETETTAVHVWQLSACRLPLAMAKPGQLLIVPSKSGLAPRSQRAPPATYLASSTCCPICARLGQQGSLGNHLPERQH